MASKNKRLADNAPGPFYVDSTCINCGACRWIAPNSFSTSADLDYSYVASQPASENERIMAFRALHSCPSASIGIEGERAHIDIASLFPAVIDRNVFHCGYHSRKSFGAASYLIVREEGNVMVDSPRYVKALVNRIEEMGGVRYLFLSHKDDVADHEKFVKKFGCERIIHSDDVNSDLRSIEKQITGAEPVSLDNDLTIIPVPGHTKGSLCLLYKDKYLFTGDHLYQNPARAFPTAFVNHCWYSWDEQIKSMERLAEFQFEWILPGHGGGINHPVEVMKRKMSLCVDWMKNV